MSNEGRIGKCFSALRQQGRGGLITFITAGDPDFDSSSAILAALPEAGADVIELGMPFSDPMADGPAIQASSLRALRNGHTMRRTLDMVKKFRRGDSNTPVVLMGYYNPVYAFGVDRFVEEARGAGADGLIIVDLPPEEAGELLEPAENHGLDCIFLTAPTSDQRRLGVILPHARGFIYHVAIAGVTGTTSARSSEVAAAIARLRNRTSLPIAVGFGIKTPSQAAAVARIADAAVVGSALVGGVADSLSSDGIPDGGLVRHIADLVSRLSGGVRAARLEA